MAGLTEDQIAFYKAEGYLLLDECLPVEAYQPLVDEFHAAIERRAREAQARGQLEDLFEDAPFDQRLALLCAAMGTDKRFVGEILGKDHKTAGLFYLLTHPAILTWSSRLLARKFWCIRSLTSAQKCPAKRKWRGIRTSRF